MKVSIPFKREGASKEVQRITRKSCGGRFQFPHEDRQRSVVITPDEIAFSKTLLRIKPIQYTLVGFSEKDKEKDLYFAKGVGTIVPEDLWQQLEEKHQKYDFIGSSEDIKAIW